MESPVNASLGAKAWAVQYALQIGPRSDFKAYRFLSSFNARYGGSAAGATRVGPKRSSMSNLFSTYAIGFIARLDGPMHFRFFMQPLVAIAFAIRDGSRDAREGRRPWAWKLAYVPEQRRALLASGWKGIWRIFVIAIVLDVIYQLIEWRTLRPLGALVTAIILAVIPYVLLRGPVNRLLRLIRDHGKQAQGRKA
jgi:hypothetical protein